MVLGNPGVNHNPAFNQIGTEPNYRLGITGYQTNYCNAPVFDSYRVGSDLVAYKNIGLANPSVNYNPTSNQIGTEPNDGLGITGYQSNYPNDQVPDSYRVGSDLCAQTKDGIDFSKPMTQLLESFGDLNLILMSGFNVVPACSNNWRQLMWTQLTAHDDRLSKLENTLSISMRTVQSVNSEIGVEQKRVPSVVHQHESLVRDLNQDGSPMICSGS